MATSPTVQPMSLEQFGQTIKAKHPEYGDLSDSDVATKVLAKYPQYKDMVQTAPTPPTDSRNSIQKSFDENTQINSNDTLLQKGLKSVVGTVGAPFVHPLDTITHIIPKDFATQYQEAQQQPKQSLASGLVTGAGQAFGGLALGAAGGEAAGAVARTPAVAAAMETIGNSSPAAALRSAGAKMLPSLVDGPPESLMTRAVRPGKNNTGWNADVQKAVPLMKSAEEQLGRPVAGIDDALEAAQLAKKGIWQQYQARLGASGKTGATIDGNAIADQMVGSIDKRTALQNPGLVDKVKAIADTYRRPLSLNEAEDFLQSANKDLNTYYTKNKVGQQVAMNDPEISSTVAEADALRKGLYSKLDQVSGPGAAQLKQAYGSLTNVEKELYGRQLVAARQAPESLSEQLSTVRGAGKIAKGVFTASPGDVLEGAQNIAVSRALKARNSSDAMIERAFQAAQPAQPFPMPSSPRFAGLLERGPIQAPAPAGGASPTSPPAIAIDATTRAQRLGLLLPEKTGGPIELPYVPGMSAGERAAALNQWLRQRQQLALPATSTPIRLPPPR